ncbi:hypothetical protein BC628DRAFT_224997 [Trametes gibbosa]|nr:hypothetical protein BC628DRAFT_224997 [Trametes gibbosa]
MIRLSPWSTPWRRGLPLQRLGSAQAKLQSAADAITVVLPLLSTFCTVRPSALSTGTVGRDCGVPSTRSSRLTSHHRPPARVRSVCHGLREPLQNPIEDKLTTLLWRAALSLLPAATPGVTETFTVCLGTTSPPHRSARRTRRNSSYTLASAPSATCLTAQRCDHSWNTSSTDHRAAQWRCSRHSQRRARARAASKSIMRPFAKIAMSWGRCRTTYQGRGR